MYAIRSYYVCLPDAMLDAVRPGIALYGYLSADNSFGLEPVMKIKTQVLAVRNLPTGVPVSYGRTFVTKRESRIAVVSLGYADGYNRLFSNNAEMLVGGYRVPVVGRVCMDLTMLDVTDAGRVSAGDEVVILGTQNGQVITASEFVITSYSIHYTKLYEALCRLDPVPERLLRRRPLLRRSLHRPVQGL